MKPPKMNILRHYWGTTTHKFWVAAYIIQFCFRLLRRALKHDLSKYSLSESRGFFKVIHKLNGLTYGSQEYKDTLAEIKPSLDCHYKTNSHHPEFYAQGIRNFSLEDLIEMWCDWKAAVKRHKDGSLHRSIELNKDRFKMGDILPEILSNTHLRSYT